MNGHGHEPEGLLTGKPPGCAHAYRFFGPAVQLRSNRWGELQQHEAEYVEEWGQEDGTSRVFVVRRQWTNRHRRDGHTMTESWRVVDVEEFPSVGEAMEARPDWKVPPSRRDGR